MNQLNLFTELTRLKKPIGFMLLFWPCIWGLTIAYNFNSSLLNYFFYSFLFLSGSILMRSAGCIVNDIADKNFDKKVERTKDRPIASGRVSVKLAFIYSLVLCFIAFLVLINFNKFTILMALASMPLAFTYPLMKRITYWPQLFLGITFNYGLILAWISILNEISLKNITIYTLIKIKSRWSFMMPSWRRHARSSLMRWLIMMTIVCQRHGRPKSSAQVSLN